MALWRRRYEKQPPSLELIVELLARLGMRVDMLADGIPNPEYWFFWQKSGKPDAPEQEEGDDLLDPDSEQARLDREAFAASRGR